MLLVLLPALKTKHSPKLAGEAHGRLVSVDRIEAGALPEGSSDPVILLVKEASGDEEVGAAGANLKGVILSHSLPHLSHLGELLGSLVPCQGNYHDTVSLVCARQHCRQRSFTCLRAS